MKFIEILVITEIIVILVIPIEIINNLGYNVVIRNPGRRHVWMKYSNTLSPVHLSNIELLSVLHQIKLYVL